LLAPSRSEEQGFVVKEILRTGTWKVTPTRRWSRQERPADDHQGRQERQGQGHHLALQELVENFKALDMRVQIPLTDDDDDHKNITATNTGYVRDIWIVDSANCSKLVANVEFTEPDVKDKVLRGTYADVSCGIPWQVVSRGENLRHVARTRRHHQPSLHRRSRRLHRDVRTENRKVILHFAEQPEVQEKIVEKIVDPFGGLSYKQIMEQAESSLPDTLKDSRRRGHQGGRHRRQARRRRRCRWLVPFEVEEGKVAPRPRAGRTSTTEGEPKAPEGPPGPSHAPSQPPAPPTPVAESSGDPARS
jgi:hypothetical protein